jgi:hypothetical protein
LVLQFGMKNYRTIFAAPAICGALLVGMAAERSAWITPAAAVPYHRRAKTAVESIPLQIARWSAVPVPIPPEAIAILRPNVILSLQYREDDLANPHARDRWANLLVDQCRDARDMNGHWPHNCYVNSGQEETLAVPRDWQVGTLKITGTEYHFRQPSLTGPSETAVYNFLIVPDRGILRDMDGVRQASADLQRRFFGAAQFQVVMNADLPQAERDKMFVTLMEPCVPVIRTLMSSGGNQ